MLYKIRGLIVSEKRAFWDSEKYQEYESVVEKEHIYYIECNSFIEALNKSQKIFNEIYDITEMEGDFLSLDY